MRFELISPQIPGLSTTEQILINRGIKKEDISHYLNTSENDIYSFSLLDNLEEGAKMLISHIAKKDKVLVQVDSDADGLTSAAALINYLNYLFPHFTQKYISYRLHKGKEHGLITSTIPDDVKLVIAPDSSSNDYEVHKELKDKGIDVLVLDHHNAERISENACVINNQLCDYPNKALSGVGVVYKFCCYIDSLLDTEYAKEILDLVALGMIADMMDLHSLETKELISEGLSRIQNPYFKGMITQNEFFLKDGITPIGVAFSVSPAMNAVVRVGTDEEKVVLFESMLDFRALELVPSTKRGYKGTFETRVEQACRNCVNIKKRQTVAIDNSLEIIEQIIEEKNLVNNKIMAVKVRASQAITKTLTGLIANKLAAKYQRPVLILNETVHKNEETNETYVKWEGSGRGYGIENLQSFLSDSGFVEYAEGHDNAMGVGILEENFEKFITYANDALKDFDFTPKYNVDIIYKPDNVNGQEIMQIASLRNLWGQGMPEPYIAIEGLKVFKENIALLGRGTLKIALPDSEVSIIKFRSSNEEYESLYSELGCVTINLVGQCKINDFGGVEKPQIEITDYEIIGRTAYYF